MSDASQAAIPPRSDVRYHPGYRFLRLFADIRQGEASKALLLSLNVFLLLLAYYILKPLRESLLLVDKESAAVKSYLGGAQAILFVFVIKAFSRLASKVPRHVLITWTTSFFISNLALFYVLHVGGMAVTATTEVVSTAAGKLSPGMYTFGLTTYDLVAPINERLQREGKPPITAQQLDMTVHAIVQRGVRDGQLDREIIIDELAKNTALSKADAQDIATDIQTRYQNMAAQVKEAADRGTQEAKHAALVAADRTGKVLLLGGVMMLLSLGAALAGAALGVPRYRRVEPEAATEVPVRTDIA